MTSSSSPPTHTTDTISDTCDTAGGLLEEFGPSIYVADGPARASYFYGVFRYPTRMAAIRLLGDDDCRRAWIWCPIPLTEALAQEVVAKCGPVRYLVTPNNIQQRATDGDRILRQWRDRFPEAVVYAPRPRRRQQGHAGGKQQTNGTTDPVTTSLLAEESDKKSDDTMAVTSSPSSSSSWADEIDRVAVRGSVLVEEVVFYHHASRTILFCDLLQRFPERAATGWRGVLLRLNGVVGQYGGTPRDLRLTFFDRRAARAARDRIMDWNADRLVVAHGDCLPEGGAAYYVARALWWM